MFPTLEVFNRKIAEKQADVMAWKNLQMFELYRIVEKKLIKNGRFGDALILRITRRDDTQVNVWAPKYLMDMLTEKTLPCYVRPTGPRACKSDPERKYQSFELLTEEELK